MLFHACAIFDVSFGPIHTFMYGSSIPSVKFVCNFRGENAREFDEALPSYFVNMLFAQVAM